MFPRQIFSIPCCQTVNLNHIYSIDHNGFGGLILFIELCFLRFLSDS